MSYGAPHCLPGSGQQRRNGDVGALPTCTGGTISAGPRLMPRILTLQYIQRRSEDNRQLRRLDDQSYATIQRFKGSV